MATKTSTVFTRNKMENTVNETRVCHKSHLFIGEQLQIASEVHSAEEGDAIAVKESSENQTNTRRMRERSKHNSIRKQFFTRFVPVGIHKIES